MRSISFDVDDLPYGALLPQLLDAVFASLGILANRGLGGSGLQELDHGAINAAFSFLTDAPREGINRHLSYHVGQELPGLWAEGSSTKKQAAQPTRMSLVICNWFDAIDDAKRWRIHPASTGRRRREMPVAFLPSPLAILYDLLTDPEDSSTRAYAQVSIRNILLRSFRIAPSGFGPAPEGWKTMTPEDVSVALSTISTFHAGRDNIRAARRSDIDNFVRHFMAAKGMMHFRFGSRENKPTDGLRDRSEYCKRGILHPKAESFEFRPDPDLAQVPGLSDIENEIWGVPLPVRGADTLFFGGLRFSETGGLVVGVSGGPGTGKTSFALSLIGRLAPLGTKTLYVTAEEAKEDLYARISSIVADRTKRLSFAPKYDRTGSSDWLFIRSGRDPSNPDQELDPELLVNFLEDIRTIRSETRQEYAPSAPPPHPCKLVVVLDNLHSFVPHLPSPDEKNSQHPLEQIISACRSIGALVIATFAKDWWGSAWIDYLVDTAVELEYEQTNVRGHKPARLMILRKTRQQISRPGAHGFHMSGNSGFRITPQIPSQLDRKAIFKSVLPDRDWQIDVFRRPCFRDELAGMPGAMKGTRVPEFDTASLNDHLRIAVNSHVLLHGKGSGGKAGLALKIAVAPILPFVPLSSAHVKRRKVLVISFLYPEQYYLDVSDHLHALAKREYDDAGVAVSEQARVEVVSLYPGYIQPEDLFDRIMRRIDKAELEGEPFTAIVLDGLHNVGLQFPLLQDYPMLWPALYATLRRKKLTVVTTHTMITVESGVSHTESISIDDPRSLPLLQALVQGSDYVLAIDRVPNPKTKWPEDYQGIGAAMEVRVVSANYQGIPQDELFWSRDKLVLFIDQESQPKLSLQTSHAIQSRSNLSSRE